MTIEDSAVQNLAAIDLGSNSFHMKIVRVTDNDLMVVDRIRDSVRLAMGLDEDNRIDAEAQQRAINCMTRFGERLRGIPPENIRAVGTNTLRKARNSARFLKQLERALGHTIEIISGAEEARLIYLGVAHSIAADDRRRLVMDIGGGSTEYIIGEGFSPIRVVSLYMGCISMMRRFFPDGVFSRKAWKRAVLATKVELEPIISEYKKLGWDVAIGASGSIKSIAKVISATERGDLITGKILSELAEEVLAAGNVKALKMSGLSEERKQTFAGGLVIMQGTFEALGIAAMQSSDGALREGVLYNHVKRIRQEDVRSSSIRGLANLYRVNEAQAQRVLETATLLLEQVRVTWSLNTDEWRDLLLWSAQIYEIGMAITHSQHQKHAAYILAHSDLAGFSRMEQKRLGMLVSAHRGKFSLSSFRMLPSSERKSLQRLAILLRLSTLLRRSRNSEPLPGIVLTIKKKNISLVFPAGWLDDHPLTQADLAQEADYLLAAGYRFDFS